MDIVLYWKLVATRMIEFVLSLPKIIVYIVVTQSPINDKVISDLYAVCM